MARQRRSPEDMLAALVSEKHRVEALIQQAKARAQEAQRKARLRRRAVLGAVLEPYLDTPGEKGDALRVLLAQLPMKPNERSVLCTLPLNQTE